MAQNSINYNLKSLVELQETILQILAERGDVTVTSSDCLGSVPELIKNLSNKSYVSTSVQTDIAKCGQLITRFAIFSDIHLASPYKYPDTYKDNDGYLRGKAAFQQYAIEAMNGNLDFVVFTGDSYGPEGGSTDEYGSIKTIFDEYRSIIAPTGIPLYMIPGNHDSGCGIETWHEVSNMASYDDSVHFMNNDRTCFYKEINGDLYIWFALFNNKMFVYSDEQYEWLFNLLDANKDKTRIFLFSHWYDGTVDEFGWRYLNGKYINHGWHTTDDERFGRIKSYKNLIWFSGHAHTDWKYEDKYPNIKVHSNNTARMVNIPSMKDNNEDVRVSVYSNMVVVEPYANNKRYDTKIYYIGNGVTENVIRINQYLTGVTSTNQKLSVSEGDSFSTTLALREYYTNLQVQVYMDGVNITENVYNPSTGIISIPSVTGTVDITASGTSIVKTYDVSYTLSGYTTTSSNQIVENAAFQIVLIPSDGFDVNTDSINVTIEGLGKVINNGYENSDYIDIQTVNGVTTLYFTSEMAIGNVSVTANASKSLFITYQLDSGYSLDNNVTEINYGDEYVANIIAQDLSDIDIQILINGVNMASTYYNNGVIRIPSVTTDLVIKIQGMDAKYPDYVKMVYDVTDISSPTQLLYNSYNVSKYIVEMVVDGESIQAPVVSYQFDSVGKHTVYMKLTNGEFHSNFARDCVDLESIVVPSSVTVYSAYLFKGCTKLKSVIINCTTAVSLSTYIFYDNPVLETIVFGSGITGIAQNNFNTACSSVKEIYIYNPTTFNWLAPAISNTGTLHYVDGLDISTLTSKLPNFTTIADL